ncbi:MAG TPA: DNA methyltransferase [Pyrinomonadaceae bacterium]|jgi:type II restriction/modification system DNA methylase subunit YeeA|nr:DNA methyltransferase [Pyrinomonadaceae bacterium]
MNVSGFVAKWRKSTRTERSASQEHFLDLCELFGHPKPAEHDPTGERFTFERGADKHGGGKGWADVWKRDFFGWEYKGKHKDLDAAYDQLLKYRESLENPPLLVVSDMERIVVHTNFNATANKTYEITLDNFDTPRHLEIMRAVFFEPDRLRPDRTSEAITTEVAERLARVAQGLRERGLDATVVAHFLDRIVFCLFAEDVGLLPEQLFSRIVEKSRDPEHFSKLIGGLFEAMAVGGDFGLETIRHFNGNLFTESPVLPLTSEEIKHVQAAARLDWGAVDPSIFGTLFERGLDPAKRSQLGAQYTGRADIETLIEPVVMQPLRREWQETRAAIENLLATGKRNPTGREKPLARDAANRAHREARALLRQFHERLAEIKVLDPACGSGNFLYVTLQKFKDLEKEVLIYAQDKELGAFLPLVGPWQFYGIEINPYAFDLAQTTLWIGYLQWIQANGFGWPGEPILSRMLNFHNTDAILDLSDPAHPAEPQWPAVDYIIGNPPFLGGKRIRGEIGDNYFEAVLSVYKDKIPPFSDLCCYWFEKARHQIEENRCKRAGFLATQGIRGGANREVLKRIKQSGDIFFAESDRNWILDGAAVHVSMIGFDNGSEQLHILDGKEVNRINSNLTPGADTTKAKRLIENQRQSFIGIQKSGPFDFPIQTALNFMSIPNPTGVCNSDVIRPYLNALDLVRRNQDTWIIDFSELTLEEAAGYETPFEYVKNHVKPMRDVIRRERHKEEWWLYGETRQGMRAAIKTFKRTLATPLVAKHHVMCWVNCVAIPSNLLVVITSDNDYWFGILHSRIHEVWARIQGTQLREKESGARYTPTTCFETFPFPESSQESLIAEAARELDELRQRWLNPPEWTREEVLEFSGSVDGPWARYVHGAGADGVGTVRYPRVVARDEAAAAQLAKRTLTNLYNQRPTWLDLAHRKLDEAVCAAYGWQSSLSDEEILARLLELNLQRAPHATEPAQTANAIR